MNIGKLFAAGIIALLAGAGPVAADSLKEEAIARLTASHSPDVPQAVARLAAKQAGLGAVRKILLARGKAAGLGRDWNAKLGEWQEAEAHFLPRIDELIVQRIENPAWVHAVIAEQAAKVLNAEEADEIASHFATASGREQNKVVEIKVFGELLLSNYTFTNRIDNLVTGSESEYSRMQKVWYDREPFKSRNFDGDERAAWFGTRNPGVKYVKILAFRGVEGFLAHIDAVCAEVVRTVDQSAAEADPFINAYRQRTGK